MVQQCHASTCSGGSGACWHTVNTKSAYWQARTDAARRILDEWEKVTQNGSDVSYAEGLVRAATLIRG